MQEHKYCPFENVICFIKCRHVNFIPKTLLSLLVFIVYEEDILAKRKRLKETVRCASYK